MTRATYKHKTVMTDATTTYDGNEYRMTVANLDCGETRNRISIHVNGFWAGSGRWNADKARIEEQCAIYSDDPQYVTDGIDVLSAAIREAMSDA